MKLITEQFKQLLVTAMLALFIIPAFGQIKHVASMYKNQAVLSLSLKEFYQLASDADIDFKFPKGFREVKAPDNEDFSFDYGIGLPGKEFEIWFQVKSEKENWASYERNQNNKNFPAS